MYNLKLTLILFRMTQSLKLKKLYSLNKISGKSIKSIYMITKLILIYGNLNGLLIYFYL